MKYLIALAFVTAMLRPAEAQVAQWTLQPLARIGSIDDERQALTWVSQILIGPDHRVYVAQPQDHRILVFDSLGRRIGSMGSRGRGPGEFESVSAIGFRHDTLYVTDDRLRRVSFFEAAGSYITSQQIVSPLIGSAPPVMYFPTVPQLLLPDGTGLVKPGVPVALLASGTGRVPFLHIGRDGQVLDTLLWQELPPETFEIPAAGGRFFAPRPFLQTPLVHLLSDGSGVLVVERPAPASRRQGNFRVTKIGVDGDTLFSRTFPYVPIPLARQQIDQAVQRVEARLSRRTNPPDRAQIERAMRNSELIPETLMPITDVASGADGSIWLGHEAASPVITWTVLGSAGEVQASLTLAASQVVKAVTREHLAALELDSLDVPYVLMYRIRRN